MIRRKEECATEYKEHMRDGNGTVELTRFINSPEELNGKGRLFCLNTLRPGTSIGYHVHEDESEIYYILRGTAEYNDNGELFEVKPGDVTFCPDGSGHGIENKSNEIVEFVALILYK